MLKAKTILLACLVLNAASLFAAEGWHSLGNVSGVKVLPNGVELAAGKASVRVVALSGNVVRVSARSLLCSFARSLRQRAGGQSGTVA
jgi:hypothetical protein